MSRLTVKAPTGLIHLKNNMEMNEAIKSCLTMRSWRSKGN